MLLLPIRFVYFSCNTSSEIIDAAYHSQQSNVVPTLGTCMMQQAHVRFPTILAQWLPSRAWHVATPRRGLPAPLQPRTSRGMAARAEKQDQGHQVPSTSVVAEDAVDPEIKAFQEYQRTAARLSLADEVRTLVSLGRWGVLCTQGRQQLDGFPCGSVVEYALTETGLPVFAFSTLSPHTGDLQANTRASLVVTAPEFKVPHSSRLAACRVAFHAAVCFYAAVCFPC